MWRWCVQFTETCCAVLLEGTCDFDCFCRTAVHFPFICASPFGGGESSLRLRKSPWYELYKGQVQLDLLQVRIKTHNKLTQTNSASDRVLFQYNTFHHKSLLSHQGMRQEMSLPFLRCVWDVTFSESQYLSWLVFSRFCTSKLKTKSQASWQSQTHYHSRETLVKIHEIRFTLRISLLDTSFWLLLNIRRTLSRLCLWRGVKSPSAESPICLVFQRLLSPIGKMWSIQESLVASCQSILEFTYRIYIISECSDVWVELTKPNKILKDTQTFGSS